MGLSRTGSPGSFQVLKENKDPYYEADGKTLAPQSRSHAAPGCPSNRILKETGEGGGTVCQYNYADHMTLRPSIDQTSAMLNTNFKVTENLDTFVRLSGTHRDVTWVFAPSPAGSGTGLGISGKQAKTYAAKLGPTLSETLNKAFENLQDTDFVDISYRLLELGNRVSEVATDQYSTLAGATMELNETWEVEVSAGYNRSFRRDLGVSGYAHRDALKDRLSHHFNAFASLGQRGDLSDLNYKTWATSETNLTFAEVSATGEVFEVNAGPVGMAVGSQVYRETFHIDADEATKKNKIIGGAGSELGGERSVVSGYVELSVPLSPSIEWGLAGRQDSYSDFGQAFSPKTSLRWQATPNMMVRSSIGSGFKAPNLDDLYKATSHGYPWFIDRIICNKNGGTDCRPRQWEVIGKGNRNLKEERSLSASLGTVIQPADNIAIGLDGWYLKLDNHVGIDYEDVTIAEERFGPSYLERFGVHVDRDPASGAIKTMTLPVQNLTELETTGVDLSTEISTNTTMGRLGFALQHSHVFFTKSIGFPGLVKKNRLGKLERPPWRNAISVTYAPTINQSGSIVTRTVAAHEKLAPQAGDIGQYTEIDLQYTYNGSWGGVVSAGIAQRAGNHSFR